MDDKDTALRDGRARAHATLDRALFLCDPNMFPQLKLLPKTLPVEGTHQSGKLTFASFYKKRIVYVHCTQRLILLFSFHT